MDKYQSYKPSDLEWIGEIPDEWLISKFKFDTKTPVQYGLNISGDKYLDEGIRFIRITDLLENGGLIPDDGKYLDENDVPKEFLLNKFDVLFCRTGHTVGKSYLHLEDGIYTSGGYLVRFNFGTYFESKFIFYISKTSFYWDWIKLNSVISTIENVNGDKYQNFQYPKPSKSEQKEIVQFLDKKTELVDKLISTKERKITLLKEQRISLINQVVTKGLNPNVKMKNSVVEWIGEIPEHWVLVPLKYLSDFQNGFGFKSELWTDVGVPIIRIQNLNGGDNYNFYSYDKNFEKYEVTKGDLLYSWSGNVGTSFGPFLWGNEGTYYLNQHIFLVKSKIEININWYFNVLKQMTKYVEEYFTTGVIGLVHITKDELGGSRIPLPPYNEQNEIVKYIDSKTKEIDELVKLEQKKIDLLKEYRQSLISEVVTGKIKVTK